MPKTKQSMVVARRAMSIGRLKASAGAFPLVKTRLSASAGRLTVRAGSVPMAVGRVATGGGKLPAGKTEAAAGVGRLAVFAGRMAIFVGRRSAHVELGAHVALKMLNRVLIERRGGLRFDHFTEVRAAQAFTEILTAS